MKLARKALLRNNNWLNMTLSQRILHDRINARAEYPLQSKWFFKERLLLDRKLRGL